MLIEAELLEEWLAKAIGENSDDFQSHAAKVTVGFDEFLAPLRNDLKVASRHSRVRRTVMQEIRRRFG